MTLDQRIDAAMADHPHRATRPAWRHDDVETTVRLLLARQRSLASATAAEIAGLATAIATSDDEAPTQRVRIAGQDVGVGAREIWISPHRLLASALVPGLHARRDMPREEDVHERALARINALLVADGRAAVALTAAAPKTSYGVDYEATEIEVRTPERRHETYRLTGQFEHRPPAEFERSAERIVRMIAGRIDHRRRIAAARDRTEREVAAAIADVEGMRVVGSEYIMDGWSILRNGVFSGRPQALVEMIGARLEPETIRITMEHDEGQALGRKVREHHANVRRLGAAAADAARTCDPILANAVAAVEPRYAADLLAEFEALLAGRSTRPANPRLRRIANLSIQRGTVRAPVALGKDVRHHRDHIQAKPIKAIPDTMLAALPGRRMREIIDHAWLEGLTIRSASINSHGLRLRAAETGVPLQPVLEALRTKAAAHAASPKAKPRTNKRRGAR